MSVYAYIACHDSKVCMFLGKYVQPTDQPDYFHIGGAQMPPNSGNPELTKALWKFLVDHVEHRIEVVTDHSDNFDEVAGYAEIGCDSSEDIPLDDYLDGFTG